MHFKKCFFKLGFCNYSLKNVIYGALFCFLVTFCQCVEGSCFRPAGRQDGRPTVGMAVGILLTTFLVIGKYDFSEPRFPAPSLRCELIMPSIGVLWGFLALGINQEYKSPVNHIKVSWLRNTVSKLPSSCHFLAWIFMLTFIPEGSLLTSHSLL